jgi:predicted lysophospholipase L1 biosynthesis ABC-type transport system permease subunit
MRVGIYLWYLAGRVGGRRNLRVSGPDVQVAIGGSRPAISRGLADLHRAGLVELTSRPRHAYLVTLPDDATLTAWLEDNGPPHA